MLDNKVYWLILNVIVEEAVIYPSWSGLIVVILGVELSE